MSCYKWCDNSPWSLPVEEAVLKLTKETALLVKNVCNDHTHEME